MSQYEPVFLPLVPGLPPNTNISPEFNLRRPTMHDNNVVLPQPEAPKRPYLQIEIKKNAMNKATTINIY